MQCGTDSPLYTWLFHTLHSARTQQNDWVESLRCINLAQTSTHVYYLCSQSKAWAAKLPLRLLLQPCAKVSLMSVLVLFFFMRWVQCIYGSNLGFRLCFFRWSCVRRFYSLVLLRWDPWVFVPSSPPPPQNFLLQFLGRHEIVLADIGSGSCLKLTDHFNSAHSRPIPWLMQTLRLLAKVSR